MAQPNPNPPSPEKPPSGFNSRQRATYQVENLDASFRESGWSTVGETRLEPEPSKYGIDLYWIPLGAGGAGFVRLNGRLYEAIRARLDRREALDLYHTAVEVRLPGGRFTVENAWPSPDADTASRGVVLEGPVGSRWMARFRPFRYEVRCWRDGVIPDVGEAVASPQLLSDDPLRAQLLLDLVDSVPPLIWGRDVLGTGEMWNSNSVISWLLTRTGLATDGIQPPTGGRAPGWETGVVIARRREGPRTEFGGLTETSSPNNPRAMEMSTSNHEVVR
jgi:hypothetical protein